MRTKSAALFPRFLSFFTLAMLLATAVFCLPSRSPAAALNLDVRPENPTVLQYSEAESALQIRIVAPQGVISDDRPPLNLALVLDKSGSMADEGKIRYVRRAAHMLVNRLGPEDVLSIVTYDNRVRVPVSARKVRCEPSLRVTSAPVMGRMSRPLATRENSMAPHRLSWSVRARASYPSSLARASSSPT